MLPILSITREGQSVKLTTESLSLFAYPGNLLLGQTRWGRPTLRICSKYRRKLYRRPPALSYLCMIGLACSAKSPASSLSALACPAYRSLTNGTREIGRICTEYIPASRHRKLSAVETPRPTQSCSSTVPGTSEASTRGACVVVFYYCETLTFDSTSKWFGLKTSVGG